MAPPFGLSRERRRGAARAPYDHFRVDRQGNLVSSDTLQHYHRLVGPFFEWLRDAHPDVEGFEDLDVSVIRSYRAALSTRVSARTGRPFEPATIVDARRLRITFLRWAAAEEYPDDQRILKLKAPRVPSKEATAYHVRQLRAVLAACDPKLPQEELVVRILVGSGVRASEVCGLALEGPDGLSDLVIDSLTRGRVELRVRWDSTGWWSWPTTRPCARRWRIWSRRRRRAAAAATASSRWTAAGTSPPSSASGPHARTTRTSTRTSCSRTCAGARTAAGAPSTPGSCTRAPRPPATCTRPISVTG